MIRHALARPIVAVAIVALIVHFMTILAIPRVVMWYVLDGATRIGGVNAAHHPPPVTATRHGIPLPSPDLLYSTCVLDLDSGPVEISVTPGKEYLSLSIFDSNTNNVFVANDQTSHGGAINLFVTSSTAQPPGATPPPAPAGYTAVRVSTDRALLLLRALASTPQMQAEADGVRHSLVCAPAKI